MLVNRHPAIDLSKVQLSPVRPYNGFAVSTESFDRDKIKMLKGHI